LVHEREPAALSSSALSVLTVWRVIVQESSRRPALLASFGIVAIASAKL
jgi:hypothetical protein